MHNVLFQMLISTFMLYLSGSIVFDNYTKGMAGGKGSAWNFVWMGLAVLMFVFFAIVLYGEFMLLNDCTDKGVSPLKCDKFNPA